MRTSFGGVLARPVDPTEAASISRRVAVICAGVLLVVGVIVLSYFFWWTSYSSPCAQAGRYLDDEVRAGRGCLLSRDWAHVDSGTGLVVARIARGAFQCGVVPDVWQSPCPGSDPDACIEGWNEALRRHLTAGEPCGPRFVGRATTLATLRARFRRDAAATLTLPGNQVVAVGDHDVRWWDSSVTVRERGASRWLQPAGGAPVEPELDRELIVVAALTADAGRTLWVRVASKADEDLWYFVVDLATGTNFQVFDASMNKR